MHLNRFRARPISFEIWPSHRIISTPFKKKLGCDSNEPITSIISLTNCVISEYMHYDHALGKRVRKH